MPSKRFFLRCQAILLDMDGTLVDSTAVIHRTWQWFAEQHSLPLADILRVERGRPNREVISQFAAHLDVENESQRFLEAERADIEGLAVIPGARELVESAQQGKWAVVTSAERSLAEVRLRAVGIPVPTVLVTADSIGKGKPDPECYLLAAELLKVKPDDCVVFEDSPSGVRSGRAAGMAVVGVGPYVEEGDGAACHVANFLGTSVTYNAQGFTIQVNVN